MDRRAPIMLGQSQKQNTTVKSKPKLVSGPMVGVIHQSIPKHHQFKNICSFYKVLYGKWTERVRLTRLLYITFASLCDTLVYVALTILVHFNTNFGLLFPVVCFAFVFDQTLVEHLCSDKGLLSALIWTNFDLQLVYQFKAISGVNPPCCGTCHTLDWTQKQEWTLFVCWGCYCPS